MMDQPAKAEYAPQMSGAYAHSVLATNTFNLVLELWPQFDSQRMIGRLIVRL